jgi:hypothetical protein
MTAAAVGREEEILMSHKFLRIVAVVILATLTAAGAAQASGRRVSAAPRAGVVATWAQVAGWLHALPGVVLRSLQALAPSAGQPGANQPTPDEGSQMDPNGG